MQDKDWSRVETDVLFDLCRQFELKFLIIHDRWNNVLYPDRSVEDLKERYYTICTSLEYARTKRQTDKYNFDAAHERRRKEQLNKLLSRTKAEVRNSNDQHDLIEFDLFFFFSGRRRAVFDERIETH